MEQRFAFVLRIWLTDEVAPHSRAGCGDEFPVGGLRGMLQTASSAEPYYFVSLNQLNQLLVAALRGQAPFLANDQPPSVSK